MGCIPYASLDNDMCFCHNDYMSENFTPLQSPYSPQTTSSSISRKQIVGAITTLGLLVAIGGGMFFVNRSQTSSTKAYSTNECVAQDGFVWGDTCPANTTQIGSISDSGQFSTSSTGGTQSCCTRTDSQQTQTTQTSTSNTPDSTAPGSAVPGTGDGDQVPPPNTVPPGACEVKKPVLTIVCPDGC